MVWLTWRLNRFELIGMLGGATVVAVVAVVASAFAQQVRLELGVDSCVPLPTGNMNCIDLTQRWSDRVGFWRYFWMAFLVIPVLVASYVGGPLFARDLERGTHRLVLTQAVSRLRWAGTSLAVVLAVAIAAGAILALVGGQLRHLMGGSFGLTGRPWDMFEFEGPALLGFMAFAVAIGSLIGAWHKRILTGMLFGLLVFILVRGAIGSVLRPRYEPPVAVKLVPSQPVTRSDQFVPPTQLVPTDAWLVGSDAIDGQGRPVSEERVRKLMDDYVGSCRAAPGSGCDSVAYLNERDVYQRMLYQPADRYWRFQAIEAGIYALLTTLSVALTLLMIKRRDA